MKSRRAEERVPDKLSTSDISTQRDQERDKTSVRTVAREPDMLVIAREFDATTPDIDPIFT